MSLLNQEILEQVQESLQNLSNPVMLRLFTKQDGCVMCEDTHQLLEEVAEASEKVRFEVFDIHANADLAQEHALQDAPALVILAEQEDGTHVDFGVAFLGIPSGYEFTSLINSMLLVSSGQSGLQQATLDALNELETDVDVQVFVTPTCPYCPQAVVLAHQMAIASPHFRAAMVEATEFPELSMQHGISGVPHSVINNTGHVVGSVPEARLISEIEQVLAV